MAIAMRIVCPNCNTSYDAPDSVVAVGKVLRCARCRTEWMPGKVVQADSADAALLGDRQVDIDDARVPGLDAARGPEPGHVADVRSRASAPQAGLAPAEDGEPYIHAPFPPMPEPPRGPRMEVIAAWGASALVLILALSLGIAYRQPVMRHWPAATRAYAMLGYK